MFAGLPGKLFLGLMGILFIVAIISGIVVYAPSMRKLKFGTYRADRPRIVRWLDVHNLSGIQLVTWTLVVGATGFINTSADLVAPYKDKPPPAHYASVQSAVDTVQRLEPGMIPAFIAFPGVARQARQEPADLPAGRSAGLLPGVNAGTDYPGEATLASSLTGLGMMCCDGGHGRVAREALARASSPLSSRARGEP
jgi:hypothetical protein